MYICSTISGRFGFLYFYMEHYRNLMEVLRTPPLQSRGCSKLGVVYVVVRERDWWVWPFLGAQSQWCSNVCHAIYVQVCVRLVRRAGGWYIDAGFKFSLIWLSCSLAQVLSRVHLSMFGRPPRKVKLSAHTRSSSVCLRAARRRVATRWATVRHINWLEGVLGHLSCWWCEALLINAAI